MYVRAQPERIDVLTGKQVQSQLIILLLIASISRSMARLGMLQEAPSSVLFLKRSS